MKRKEFFILIILVLLFPVFTFLRAEDYSSSNFIIRDPVVVVAGEQSSSSSFQYYSNTGQIAPGESLSSSFVYRAGVFYYPSANSSVLSATPGNGKVDLAWTAATGTLANITNYQLGTSTISGGPYTFEDIGNALSASKTSLSNGTTYYFIVKAYAGTLFMSQSSQASAAPSGPVTPPVTPPSGGGGGGGGGGPGATTPPATTTSVIFSGRAYPLSKVTVLKDAQVAITTIAGPDANFNVTLSGLATGNYNFSVYGEDNKGRRSSLFNFPIFITQGTTTTVGGIFIAPTIDVDKSEVKRGDNISIFGQSVPNAEVTIAVNSDHEFFDKTKSDKDGIYLYNFDTSPLENGQHTTKSKAALSGSISNFGEAVGFIVGTQNVYAKAPSKILKGDLNGDGKVNLIDFSVAAYWYKRTLTPAFKLTESKYLNGDGKINLVDFSILAYYWSG